MTIKKNRKKHSLAEGFLDGEEEATSTPDDVQPEVPEESEPEGDDDVDLSDEEGAAEDDDENLDSDGDGEADDNASDEEAGVADEPEEKEQNLEDQLASLIATVQTLTDQLQKQNAPAEGENGTEPAPETDTDEPAEGDGDEGEPAPEDDEDDENADAEPEEDDSDYEGGDDDSVPEDTSEALKPFFKRGQILHEDSGSLIGKLANNRYDQLHDIVMAVVEGKLQQRIEGAKKEFRSECYKKIYGEE